jgi:hypothetical protein
MSPFLLAIASGQVPLRQPGESWRVRLYSLLQLVVSQAVGWTAVVRAEAALLSFASQGLGAKAS